MNILAFDTSLGACSVAVGIEAGGALETVETLSEEMATGQAERLLPMIDAAMRAASVAFSRLDRIAVTTGPGTFTGTRIGIAAARALALATGSALVGVSTLEVMAAEAARALGRTHEGPLAVTVDAHRGQVYAQPFASRAGGITSVASPQLLAIADAAGFAHAAPTVYVGTGAELVAAAARARGYPATSALPRLQPNAAFLLLLAQTARPAAAPLRPLYLRPADAKPQTAKALMRATQE